MSLELNFLTPREEEITVDYIDSREWNNTLTRRTQQYGFEYDFKRKMLRKVEDIPKEIKLESYDQLIINEYVGRQGIAPHTDSPLFGETIEILSLLEDCELTFLEDGKVYSKYILPQRSLFTMEGDIRWNYQHCIRNQRFGRRISLTFRSVK